uniref:Vascular cell adhesion molecule 1a n=1 Tax=Cyprinus carpio TaxID=7962 RepID=A0A8C1TRG9_CYPCA
AGWLISIMVGISNNIILLFLNSLELTPLNPVIHVGTDLELTCQMNDCPDNVTFIWKSALDKFLGGEAKDEQTVSRLLIKNISVKHSDSVLCKAICQESPQEKITEIHIVFSAAFPEDPILPKIKSLIANQEQRLICTVRNIYPLEKFQIEWLRGDKSLYEEEPEEPIFNGVQNYISVFNYTPSVDDLGKNISCKATLKLNLKNQEKTTTAECKLDISPKNSVIIYPPSICFKINSHGFKTTRGCVNDGRISFLGTIKVSSNNTSVKLGERLEITCHADGNPEPTIVWWKQGETELQSQNHKLIINNASWSQLSCLIILNLAMIFNLFFNAGPPNIPKIQLSHREEPKEGESISIFCSLDGGPAELKLYKQSQSIATGDPNEPTLLLNISSIQITDAGVYTCEAKNDFGIERSTINITVQGEFITFWRSCLGNVIAWEVSLHLYQG